MSKTWTFPEVHILNVYFHFIFHSCLHRGFSSLFSFPLPATHFSRMTLTDLCCTMLCLSVVGIFFSWMPFVFDMAKNRSHVCPECKHVLNEKAATCIDCGSLWAWKKIDLKIVRKRNCFQLKYFLIPGLRVAHCWYFRLSGLQGKLLTDLFELYLKAD